jgi:hypothetical protein
VKRRVPAAHPEGIHIPFETLVAENLVVKAEWEPLVSTIRIALAEAESRNPIGDEATC